jgi:hypothetical protein
VTTVVTKRRPQLVNKLRIFELRELIEELKAECVGDPDALQRLHLQERELRRADTQNDVAQVNDAKQTLDKIYDAVKQISCPKDRSRLQKALDEVESLARGVMKKMIRYDIFISAASVVVASALGMQALYFGHQWGGGMDYVVAFLWGFGIDAGLRGFGAVFAQLNTPLA